MLEPGTTYRSPRGAAYGRVVEHTPDRAVLERLMPPGTGKTDAHLHRDFAQVFEVVEGTASCSVDGAEGTLSAGESVDIPRGVPHVDPYNPGPGPLVVRNVVTPAGRFVDVYVSSWGRALEEGRLNSQDEFTFLGLAVMLAEARGDSWAAGPPMALQRLAVPVAARLGRLRGHRAYAAQPGLS
jgi:mannose-6-phosphate isomerase-like protein (cupin superfamily)